MENRFVAMNDQFGGNGTALLSYPTSRWVEPQSATDRALVILIRNGGVDLGIPDMVDKLLAAIPRSNMLPDSARSELVEYLTKKIKGFTDNLLENAELTANRYTAAKPSLFGDVIVLRDGTDTYQSLKNKLIELSRAGKIIDLLILTHGGSNTISAEGLITGEMIKAMKTEYGKPLSIRSVYMMNCVGSSLNQAWLDAGAKTSCGSLGNNYLPEPTMFFFWSNWKAGQTFEAASIGAYRQTVSLMNGAIRGFIESVLPIGGSLVASQIAVENFDFVKQSAPQVVGQRTVTIGTDNLTFTQTLSSGLATTVLPVSVLASLAESPSGVVSSPPSKLSAEGANFIRSLEGANGAGLDGRIAEAERAVNTLVRVPLTQEQFDALVSFVSNVGTPSFEQSALLTMLNQGNRGAVPGELRKWVKARDNGAIVEAPALVRRRDAEAQLFEHGTTSVARSGAPAAGDGALAQSYEYHSPSLVMSQSTDYTYQQNPLIIIEGIALADAIQIGLGAIAVVQAGVASIPQGGWSLSGTTAERLLTPEARAAMPGSQTSKRTYERTLITIPQFRAGNANAVVKIYWEGNSYGEIGTIRIERDLAASSEWSKSTCSIAFQRIQKIPAPNTDPRAWPIVFSYVGSYDPLGNGQCEFTGEFEVNAFGGLKFNRHQVVSRSLADWALSGRPEDWVRKAPDTIVPTPTIPQEQVNYLKAHLPS